MHIVFFGNKLFYRFKVCSFKCLLMQRIMVQTALWRFFLFLLYRYKKSFSFACSFRFEWLLPKRIDVDIFFFLSISGVPVSSSTKAKMRSNLFRQTEVLNTRRIMSEFFKHPIRIPQSTLFSRCFSFSFFVCVFVYCTIFNFNRC